MSLNDTTTASQISLDNFPVKINSWGAEILELGKIKVEQRSISEANEENIAVFFLGASRLPSLRKLIFEISSVDAILKVNTSNGPRKYKAHLRMYKMKKQGKDYFFRGM